MQTSLVALILSLSITQLSGETSQLKTNNSLSNKPCQQMVAIPLQKPQFAFRGCCSYQQKACGCYADKLVCCDGSLSMCSCRP